MKKLAIYTVVVLVLLVGGAMLTIDSIARSAIETGVEAGVGVPTRVGGVSLRLLLGSFRMDDLEISNPQGYTSAHFLKLGTAETAISYGDLRRGDVVLDRLLLEDLDVELEWKGRKANYDAILDGMGGAGSKPAPAEPEEPEAASETRFIIDELLIRNVTAHVRLGDLKAASVTLDELKLEGIGRKSGGATLQEVTQRVVKTVLAASMDKSKSLGPEVSARLGQGLQQLRGLGDQGGEGAGKVLDKAGSFLKGLRGGD